jgi:hypothetical protein
MRRAPRLAALRSAPLLFAAATAAAQTGDDVPSAAPAASAPARADAATRSAPWVPAAEIIAFDVLLNRYNARFSGSTDYDVTMDSIRRNLRGPWVVDNDPFRVNQFAHPYQGSLYHGAARSLGYGYWESAAYTFAGSLFWEIAGEQTPPARNDQVASGIAGSFLGEPLFRMSHLLLKKRSDVPFAWNQVAAAVVSPPVGLNRLLFGDRYDAAFDDHDPSYYGRLRVGANHVVQQGLATATDVRTNDAAVDFALDYGLPGREGYTYTRPFDYFAFHVAASSAHGVQYLATRGLLLGMDYAAGESVRGLWGLYASYDYQAPQIYNLSTTALSLGSTAQWWATRDVAVQATGLVGVGYAAASTSRGVPTDRDYHYGSAPRIGLALRATTSARWSVDLDADKVLLGRVANRAAGRDDITRAEAALTWRIRGLHAIGVKYTWSHRMATFPVIGDRSQTLATVGVFYTLLGQQTFGAVEWRDEDKR